ncbi:hypothetical protein CTI12_AA014230 [Artemisia annua]|uniref:Uncharacterized protein n=1 Tax=Artemisia annua TaxID=35608 RepID=A0A2U1QLR8_ARTAN|nr:hypothetical protein CTI12_AA014230 [Artemisia annua]
MRRSISNPDRLLINGSGWNGYTFHERLQCCRVFTVHTWCPKTTAMPSFTTVTQRSVYQVLPPGGPTTKIAWSIIWNLTASGPRPNPQGSYHYGMIKPGRTIML